MRRGREKRDEQGATRTMTGGPHQGDGGGCNRPRASDAGGSQLGRLAGLRGGGGGGWAVGRRAGPRRERRGERKGEGEGQATAGPRQGNRPKREGGGFPYFLFSSKFLIKEYLTKAKRIHTKEKMRGSA
jgi:hypothetical protein